MFTDLFSIPKGTTGIQFLDVHRCFDDVAIFDAQLKMNNKIE